MTIVSDLPDDLPRIPADGSLLKSAVWNLAQNGIQMMERDGGTLTVTAWRAAGSQDEGPRLVLSFEDDGPGIEAAHLPRLFEPWFSTKEGGVGLGLAMVKRIVEEHGGRVEAGNREGGRGAVFRFSLPLAPAVPGVTSRRERHAPRAPPSSSSTTRSTSASPSR